MTLAVWRTAVFPHRWRDSLEVSGPLCRRISGSWRLLEGANRQIQHKRSRTAGDVVMPSRCLAKEQRFGRAVGRLLLLSTQEETLSCDQISKYRIMASWGLRLGKLQTAGSNCRWKKCVGLQPPRMHHKACSDANRCRKTMSPGKSPHYQDTCIVPPVSGTCDLQCKSHTQGCEPTAGTNNTPIRRMSSPSQTAQPSTHHTPHFSPSRPESCPSPLVQATLTTASPKPGPTRSIWRVFFCCARIGGLEDSGRL